MPMYDPFSEFGVTGLTSAINTFANIPYGRVQELGIFSRDGIRDRFVTVEIQNNTLVLLPTVTLGGPATLNKRDKRNVRTFRVPHIPLEDVVLPEDVQGLRAFGSTDAYAGLNEFTAMILQKMAAKHAITWEHLMIGALKGIVLDADGSTIINFFTEFGVTQQVVDVQLDVGTTNVRAKLLEAKRLAEDGLAGDVFTGWRVLASQEFFDALISHADVKTAYERFRDGEMFRNDPRGGFTFADITFEEYRGRAPQPDGSTRRFIAANEAYMIPLGTRDTFRFYDAPADINSAVNTLGKPMYALTQERRMERGWDLHTQSNPLPMVQRPLSLVKLTI